MTDINKEQIKKMLQFVIELVDEKLPIVGSVMDHPIVDEMEKEAVDIFVEACFYTDDGFGDLFPWSAWALHGAL